MKGLIVCGYPGVGKSSIAGWNKCIDLESSYFSHRPAYDTHDSTFVNIPVRTDVWAKQYCPIAIDLANQGFIVMTSCHRPVIEYFMSAIYPKNVSGAVIFAPDHRYKKEWIDRLTERYNKTGLQKDERALTRAIQYFDEDMAFLNNCGLPICTPAALDYDLKDYINYIVAKKEN